MVPESHGLPKMSLGEFKLIVVLGKGSFGKVKSHSFTHKQIDIELCVCLRCF